MKIQERDLVKAKGEAGETAQEHSPYKGLFSRKGFALSHIELYPVYEKGQLPHISPL